LNIMISEEQNKAYLKKKLDNHFDIWEEQNGKHIMGNNVRIDLIIRPKEYEKWRNGKDTFLGIEIKPNYDSFYERTSMLLQCIDYRHTKFYFKNGSRSIPIFMYPSPLTSEKIDDYFMKRFLGKMNIGIIEYVDYRECLEFTLSDSPIFDTKKGARISASKHKMETTFGRQ